MVALRVDRILQGLGHDVVGEGHVARRAPGRGQLVDRPRDRVAVDHDVVDGRAALADGAVCLLLEIMVLY